MPLASVITDNLHKLDTPPAHAEAADGNPLPLSFTMQDQDQTEWCWAAVAVSVSQFYQIGPIWNEQCALVGDLLNQPCCPAGSNPDCNVTGYLNKALARVGHLNMPTDGAADGSEIAREIRAGRPLAVQIRWDDGSGYHFVIISAYSRTQNSEQVTVEDPLNGHKEMSLATLKTSYLSAGSWAYTHWTQ